MPHRPVNAAWVASQSEAVRVAVGFSPRIGRRSGRRRVATLEHTARVMRRSATRIDRWGFRGLKPTATVIRVATRPSRIPTGFRPPAQGWPGGPTLGPLQKDPLQPQRGCVSGRAQIARIATTPLGLLNLYPTVTQGSSSLATLGFMTESRWDSRMARRATLEPPAGPFMRRSATRLPGPGGPWAEAHGYRHPSRYATIANPNGIPSSSPGLARQRRAYPGTTAERLPSTPMGLRQRSGPECPHRRNPVGVVESLSHVRPE